MNPDQVVKILDVMLAFSNGFTRANDLLQRARAGEEITDDEIDSLVAQSDTKREAFDRATGG